MAIDEKMTLQLEVNMRNYARQMQRAGLVMDQAAKRIEDRLSRAERQVGGSFRNMATAGAGAFAALSSGRAVTRIGGDLIRISDAYQQLTNQVNSASAAVGHNIATIEEISDVALSSRTSLQGTTTLYTRLERSAADLNMTQQETLRITQLVGMSFAASGATIQEQRSSILQLSQALQSGILQGDELRSLREGAPEIARAIATEMGVGIGALKELGSQGLITSEVVMRAILNAGTTIQGQFNATEMTVSQAIENMRTRFTLYAAGVNEATNATRTLTGFIEYVSLNFNALTEAGVVAASVMGGTLAAAALPALTRAAIAAATSINVAATSTTILVGATGAATVSSTALVRSMVALRGAMAFLMTTPWGAAILAIGAAVGYLALEANSAASRADRLSALYARMGREVDELGQATERATRAQRDMAEQQRSDELEEATKVLREQRRELERLESQYNATQRAIATGGDFITGPTGERIFIEVDDAQLRASAQELSAELERQRVVVSDVEEMVGEYSEAIRTAARAVREATDITAILTASNEGLDKVLKMVVDTMGDVGDAQELLNDLERASAIDDATEALGRQTTALAQLEAGLRTLYALNAAGVSFFPDPTSDGSELNMSASVQAEIDAMETQADRLRGIIEIIQTLIETLNDGTNVGAASDAQREREQQLRRQATAIREAIQLQREFSRELEVTRAQFKSGETEAYTRQLEALTQAQAEASDELAVLEAQHAAGTITDALYREGLEQLAATTAILRDQREQLVAVADANQDTKFIQEQIDAQERLDTLYGRQISHEIELARLRGDETKLRALDREVQLRERIAELTGLGVSKETAQQQATQEVNQIDAARQYGEQRDMFSQAFSEGIRAAMNGDLSGFLADQFGNFADLSFQRLGEELFDSLFDAPADVVRATAEGVAQGTAAATPMTAAIVAGGATASATMSTAITTAGAAAAQAMAAAIMAADSGGGGGKGILGGILSGLAGGKNAGIPGKALGGPVRAGQPYVVGEHGPELMIPDKAGRIVPQLPSASATAMITYAPKYAIDARGATPDAVAALRREMAATRAADMQQFGTRVRGVLPGALASAQRDGAV